MFEINSRGMKFTPQAVHATASEPPFVVVELQ